MKKGWVVKTLDEISEILNGGTPDTTVQKFWDGENLWITPKDMGRLKSIYVDDTLRKITDEGLKNSSAKILPPNSIILSSRAPIGHLAINTKPISTNQGCKGLVPKKGVDTLFLYYFLSKSVDLLNSLGTGATFKELSGSKLGTVEIPLPSLPEQQRIVAILDEAFAAIAKAKANAEQNLKNAKELFESYLQGVFENKGEGWEEKTLKEVCAKITDGTHQTPKYFDDGFIFLSSRNVTSGKINWDNIKYIDEKQHIEMHKRVAPKVGDILLAKNGTTGVAAMVDRNVVFDIYVSLAHIRVLDEVTPEFMLYFINSPIAKKQFNKRLKGSGVPNLHLEEIREVVIPFPKSLKEQNKLVKNLDDFSTETKKLEGIYQQKLNDLEELKKSILQKAFAGELKTVRSIA